MASFNDYLKEIDNLKEQLKNDRDTLKLRIEQLSMFKGFYGNNFKYLSRSLYTALDYFQNCIDMIEGWIPINEKDIPEDEKFLSEMELKAKAFDNILHSWRKNQYPEEFSAEVTDIIDELLGKVSCEPDPELDQEPEDLPTEEDLKPDPETINSIMKEEAKKENSQWVAGTHLDDNKNGVAKFKAFYELLHKGK